jgi:hypothetical protein
VKLPRKPSPDFSKPQRKAWEQMLLLLQDQKRADESYNNLEDSENGKIISTDIARYLDKQYAQEPAQGKLRDIQPGWDLAWCYAEDRLQRELAQSGKGKLFRLMAGGWAAGKTHAIRHLPNKPDLVWDGTLRDPLWAARVIEFALKSHWRVEIVYIYRNLELSLYGAIQRVAESGRQVPLEELPKSHQDAQQSILELSLNYAGTDDVSFLYIHNLGKKGAIAKPLKIDLKELELHGPLHYLDRHEQ